jgi:hypothetical protein
MNQPINIKYFILILFALGCFALSSATQAVPSPPSPTNVNVVNTPNVNVVNTTASPVPVRDVDNPARQPFEAQVMGGFADGASTTGEISIATVPAGKRLVIEYVSVFGAMLTGQKMVSVEIDFRVSVNGNYHHEVEPQGSNADGTLDYFIASALVRSYVNPGPISCFAERNSFAGANPNSVTFTISGYFVDCPTCVP